MPSGTGSKVMPPPSVGLCPSRSEAMRRLVQTALFTALAACGASTLAASAEQAPSGRLPGWAMPQSYQLAFKVDPAQADFSGTTTIEVKLEKASDHLWLDGADLKVSRVEITDAAGAVHAGKYVAADAKAGVARVDFGSVLQPQQLSVKFEYTAPLNAQLQGLYKVSAKGKPYAMTQMEPISARFAFPGFDEPGFKTPFDISITAPADETVVANTKPVSEQSAGKGWKTVTFARTVPLPTYLVAFAVGPWDVVAGPDISPDAYRAKPLQQRGVAAHGEGHRLQHVLGETPSIIHALENYYGFGYPFDKLDLLAAPDFSAGAMENPGLVTFRDWLLLLDNDSPARNVRGSLGRPECSACRPAGTPLRRAAADAGCDALEPASSTCTMSGYGGGRLDGSPCAAAPHTRSASPSPLIGGNRTAASRKLTKKLVRCASSESFSQVLRACTPANGPPGHMHHHHADAPSSSPAPRNSHAGRARQVANTRQSQRQVR